MNEVITIQQAYALAGVDIKTGMRLEFRHEERPSEVAESDVKSWIEETRKQRIESLSRREFVV